MKTSKSRSPKGWVPCTGPGPIASWDSQLDTVFNDSIGRSTTFIRRPEKMNGAYPEQYKHNSPCQKKDNRG